MDDRQFFFLSFLFSFSQIFSCSPETSILETVFLFKFFKIFELILWKNYDFSLFSVSELLIIVFHFSETLAVTYEMASQVSQGLYLQFIELFCLLIFDPCLKLFLYYVQVSHV